MKCNRCGSEWTVSNTVHTVSNCPFCGEALNKDTKPDNIAETMKEIISNYRKLVEQMNIWRIEEYSSKMNRGDYIMDTLQMEVF